MLEASMRGHLVVVTIIASACGSRVAEKAAAPQVTQPEAAPNASPPDLERQRYKAAAISAARNDSRCTVSEDGAEFSCRPASAEDCTEINATLPVDFRLECPASLPTRAAITETERVKQDAEQAAIAKAEADAKAKAEAEAKANEKHIVLPGWEDVIVGHSPPADARQKCSKEPGISYTTCRGCRSAKLPTPCIEVMVNNADPDKVSMILAVLPELERDALKVSAALDKAWGKPARQLREDYVEEVSWDGALECASLITSYPDGSGRTYRRGRQLRRIATITDLGSGSTCAPSRAPSKAPPQPQAEDVCRGKNVLAVIRAVPLGRDLDSKRMRACSYAVSGGRVQTTTRDGWVMVSWVPYTAAFKTRKRYADGSMFTTKGMAKFTGLRSFERTDGSTSTVATFRLTE